jgi:heme-degrading monooxygenase HmoA
MELIVFLSISKFVVNNELDAAVSGAFRKRPRLVDSAPGFIRMATATNDLDAKELWLHTWWHDAASFDAWHRGHSFQAAHLGIPKGLKLDPARTELFRLKVFAE